MNYSVCMRMAGNETWVEIARFLIMSDALLFWDARLEKDADRHFEYRLLDGDKVLLEA